MRRLLLLVGLPLLLVACGLASPPPTPTPVFARYTADDVIRAFQATNLPVYNLAPVSPGNLSYGISVISKGQFFRTGLLGDASFFYVLQYTTQGALDVERENLASNKGYSAPRFLVKDNIILLTSNDAPNVAIRYEIVLSGMR